MPDIIEQIEIDRDVDYVFELAQDYDLRLDWDPFLKDMSFISDDKSLSRGLVVWVKAHNNMEMTVEYMNYNPPNHVSMRMVDGPFLFNNFSGLWKFNQTRVNHSQVVFKYSFSLKWIFYPFTFLVRFILARDMRKRLTALKKAAESGEYDLNITSNN